MYLESRNGFIGIAMMMLVIFMVAAMSMLMLTHSNINSHLESAKWQKGLRLDAESLENFTASVIYEFRESNPSAYGATANILAELEAQSGSVSGFAEEGGSILSITRDNSVPANHFFPDFQGSAFLDYDESAYDLPRHMESLLNAGPVAYLGNSTFTYTLSYPNRTSSFNRDIDVTTHSFLVPVTNFPVVLYGMPFTGQVQNSSDDYQWAASRIDTEAFKSAGGRILMTSIMDPANEDGVMNSFFDPNYTYIPRLYQPHTRLTWTVYELVNDAQWRDGFLFAPGQITVDMSAWDTVSYPGIDVISETEITIDADVTVASVINVIPSQPMAITVNGSNDNTKPAFSIIVHNYANHIGNIHFASTNLRPVMLLNDSMNVALAPGINLRGAIFMNAGNNTGAAHISGANATLYGHLSLDSWGGLASSYDSTWGSFAVLPDLGVRDALAEYAPCAFIVGTTSSF